MVKILRKQHNTAPALGRDKSYCKHTLGKSMKPNK